MHSTYLLDVSKQSDTFRLGKSIGETYILSYAGDGSIAITINQKQLDSLRSEIEVQDIEDMAIGGKA